MNRLPVSVVIATLNEERNIAACLERVAANRPREVIVIDGGSTDRTVAVARESGVEVYEVPKRGVAFQQQVGIHKARCPYLAIVDAFDRLAPDCLAVLLKEMEQHRYDAIQACPVVHETRTYCQKAYGFNADYSINQPGPTIMCGRPALFRTEKIKDVGFDWRFFKLGIGCVDTDVSIGFELKGYAQGKGTGKTYRDIPADWSTWLSKMVKYGRGDARLIYKYPSKKRAIRRHQLVAYPIERSLRTVRHGGLRYVPFFVMFGLVRFFVSLAAVPRPGRLPSFGDSSYGRKTCQTGTAKAPSSSVTHSNA